MNGHNMISKQQNLKWKPEDDTEVEATDAEATSEVSWTGTGAYLEDIA